jgi:hypothetical protein
VAVETNIHGLWGALQTAKGSAATAPTTGTTGVRLRLGDQGGIQTDRTDGEGAYSDLSVFGDAQDYVQSIIGSGTPPLHATPDELAWTLLFFSGQEAVTEVTGPPVKQEHESTPAASLKYATIWQRVGGSIIERKRNVDCVCNQIEITAGTGQHIVRITPTVISLDPGEVVAADPTLALDDENAFLWTESEGGLLLDGNVIEGPSQYTITLNRNLEPIYGNSTRPVHLQPGTPSGTVSLAMALDQDAFERAQTIMYGDATPGAGDKPVAHVGDLGSFKVTHTQRDNGGDLTGNLAEFEMGFVKWDPVSALAVPNPGGGGGTLELSGRMRKGDFTSRVTCDSLAFTA